MKTASAALNTHLQQEVTTLATCWRVTRRDGNQFHFTEHDLDLSIDLDATGATTYKSTSSYNRSAIRNDDQLSVDNLDLTGVLTSGDVEEVDLRRGLFDHAVVEIFLVNWEDLSQGVLNLRKGRIGEVTVTANGFFIAELRGLTQAYSRRIVEFFQAECRTDLGSALCKIPIFPAVVQRNTAYVVDDFVRASNIGSPADSFDFDDRVYRCTTAGTTAGSQPTYDTVVGNTTTDGTAVFTAEEAWSRAIEVVAVDGGTPRKKFTVTELTPNSGGATSGRDFFPSDSMNGGVVTWETGTNAGVSMEVRDFVQDDGATIEQVIELFLDLPFDISIGDRGRVYRGCFKRFDEDCKAVFDNVVNFRGEPLLPGQDAVFSYPDAKA